MKRTFKRYITRTVAAGVMSAFAVAPSVLADDDNQRPTTTSTHTTAAATAPRSADFLKNALESNQTEIAMAQLGTKKAQNAEVKELSEKLLKDHTEFGIHLRTLAQQHGVPVTTRDNEKIQEKLAKYEKMSGSQFDKEFVVATMKHHQKDISEYRSAVWEIVAADIRQTAQKLLPTLEQHLREAVQIAKNLGVDQQTITRITSPPSAAGSEVGGAVRTGEEKLDDQFHTGKEAGAQKLKEHSPQDQDSR